MDRSPLEKIEGLALRILSNLDIVGLSKEWAAAVRILCVLHRIRCIEWQQYGPFAVCNQGSFTFRDLFYLSKSDEVLNPLGTGTSAAYASSPFREKLSVRSTRRGLMLLEKVFQEPELRYQLGALPMPKGILWAPSGFVLQWSPNRDVHHELELSSVVPVPPELGRASTTFRLRLHEAHFGNPNFGAKLRAVLVVEKETTFRALLRGIHDPPGKFLRYAQLNRVAMISGKGYPDRATKVLVRYLAKTEEIPVFLLTDCDPNGIAIALQYDGATERIGVPLHGPENAGFAALRLLVDHDHSLLKQLQRRITCMDGIGASLQPPLAWMAATGYKSEIESLSNPDLTEFVIRALKQRLKVYSVHK